MAAMVFVALLMAAAVMDVRVRRVPNALCMVLLAVGLGVGALGTGQVSVLNALAGVATGLAIWLPFWLLGMLGAGDVKFFAAACAWIGPSLAWRASLGVALLGGVMALMIMARQRGLRSTAEFTALVPTTARGIVANARTGTGLASARSFPYAVPMAIVLAGARFYPDVFR